MRIGTRLGLAGVISGALCLTLAACSTSEPASQDGAVSGRTSSPPAELASAAGADQADIEVVLLGTGSPVPSVERFGNSTLVRANGLNLVFDAGRGASIRLNQLGVPIGTIDGVFLTHFHSDHVNGLADLWLTGYIPALGGREGSFHLYGPPGVSQISDGLLLTHQNDIDVRVADENLLRDTAAITPHEFDDEGVIFDRDDVRVTMFEVEHDAAGAIDPAVGYRIDYGESSVLISGDTRPTPNILKYGEDVDLLIHEVADFVDPSLPALQNVYSHHTNPQQAGEIFARTRPAMAAYSHIVHGAPPRIPDLPIEVIVERTRETYDGPLTVGEDLMAFYISDRDVRVESHTG
ncbi:MBL fold metallo-hydrolase [Rhodococcus sp. HNM0563]|uniref:MBL fold metallo-hydrolase n=1 Tax=Rhodococcus sp. HNM0563 TaxID=2716339 RepID=UPI00146ED93D|nr:MBL fold metallo-hydrolase [Rhodococcus sp. HNM0563]NLU64014.1 MBL fold metallo-hydrolase [Rhodococcus sp. HNM0563]